MIDIFRKYVTVAILITASLLGCGVFWYMHETALPQQPGYPTERYLRYTFNLRNKSDQLIAHSTFKAFAPVKQTSSQKVESIQASLPYKLEVDQLGNQLMVFDINTLPPYGSKVITVTVKLAVSNAPNRVEVQPDIYLQDSDLLQINDPGIVAQASKIASAAKEPIGTAIYRWVSTHIQYTGFDPTDEGAVYALEEARGDCTEYSQLMTALLRDRGVPARVIGGFVINGAHQVLRADDYHNWSEYLDTRRGWILADAQRRVHDMDYQNYIAFRIIEMQEENPMSSSERFLAFDQRLVVSMN